MSINSNFLRPAIVDNKYSQERSPANTSKFRSVDPLMTLLRFLLFFTFFLQGSQRTEAQTPGGDNGSNPAIAGILGGLGVTLAFTATFILAILRCSPDDQIASAGEGEGGNTRSRNSGPGVDHVLLETFSTMSYSKAKELDDENDALECAICLSGFSDDDALRLLPVCQHVFHVNCIDVWLESYVTCPICRSILSVQPGNAATQPAPLPAGHARDNATEFEGSEADRDLEAGLSLSVVVIQRWNSTGHEVGDRYTLRLPDDVQLEMIGTPTHRGASSLPAVQESDTGVGERNSRWRSLLRNLSLHRSRKEEASSSG